MSKQRKHRMKTSGRWTPPRVKLPAGPARDAAHQEIGERLKAHLDVHRTWEGPLQGHIVKLWLDADGKLHSKILGKA